MFEINWDTKKMQYGSSKAYFCQLFTLNSTLACRWPQS